MRFVSLVLLVCISGCATILASGPDHLRVESTPPGAQVTLDGQSVGVTPTTLELDRSNSTGFIDIQEAGYQPVRVFRARHLNGWYFANILNLGLGFIVDVVSGNWTKYDTTAVRVNLVPIAGGPVSATR